MPEGFNYYITKKLFGIFNVGIFGLAQGSEGLSEQDALDNFNKIYCQGNKIEFGVIVLKEFIVK